MSRGEQKEATVRDCKGYCLGFQCRHQLIADAFGEQVDTCHISCDVCVNPDAVQAGIQSATANKNEKVDNWRSSRKKLIKSINKAATGEKRRMSSGDEDSGPRSEPVKKVLKFDVKKKTMTYVKETEGNLFTISFNKSIYRMFS